MKEGLSRCPPRGAESETIDRITVCDNRGTSCMAIAGDGKARSDRRRATNRLTKRLTDEELNHFETRAAEAGFRRGQDYLSFFIAGDIRLNAATRNETIRLLGELGKIGSNVNQIARAVNQGRIKSLDTDAVRSLEATRNLIEALGQEIRETLQ